MVWLLFFATLTNTGHGTQPACGFRGFSLAIWLQGLGQRIIDRSRWETEIYPYHVSWEESYSLRNTLPMALPPPTLSPFLIIPLCYEPIKGLVDVLG